MAETSRPRSNLTYRRYATNCVGSLTDAWTAVAAIQAEARTVGDAATVEDADALQALIDRARRRLSAAVTRWESRQ